MSAKAELPAPSDVPATVRATIRGVSYTVTELSMKRYDELLKKATSKTRNEITGQDEEEIDQQTLMRLMILEAVAPKPDQLLELGVRYYRALQRLVSDLHYGDEPVKIESEDEPAEETPRGNAA
jgi:hypothetical protein